MIIGCVFAAMYYFQLKNAFRKILANPKRAIKLLVAVTLILLLTISLHDRQPLYAEGDIEESIDLNTEAPIDVEEILRQAKDCEQKHGSFKKQQSESYCNATFDQFLCWGYAKAGTSVSQNCPPDLPFIDPSSFDVIFHTYYKGNEKLADKAVRHCGLDGYWLDRHNRSSPVGWTDFIKCFPPYMQELLENVSKSTDGAMSKFRVAGWIRSVEFFGLSVSSISLIVAIIIFSVYPKLLNGRTRIHRHLFSVLLAQALTTLFIYTDQETFQFLPRYNVVCIIVYTFYEVLTSISFAFMLIEGLNLYRIVSSNALRPQISHRVLIASGYLYPMVNTFIWFAVANYKYGWNQNTRCWLGYNLDSIYWILQGPRLIVLMTNLLFMLLVVKILLKKLAQKDTTELQRIKTAVRATVFLMPLLGITNFISMTNAPLRNTTMTFAVWAFFAYFLRSLQGFFVSFIYCFRNNEVLEVVCRRPSRTINDRNDQAVRFRATNTECEIMRREDETRLEPTDPQHSEARDLNSPLNDVAIDIDGEETYEMQEVIVHRTDLPDEADAAEE